MQSIKAAFDVGSMREINAQHQFQFRIICMMKRKKKKDRIGFQETGVKILERCSFVASFEIVEMSALSSQCLNFRVFIPPSPLSPLPLVLVKIRNANRAQIVPNLDKWCIHSSESSVVGIRNYYLVFFRVQGVRQIFVFFVRSSVNRDENFKILSRDTKIIIHI